jgi:mRNA deadenylase 3'-5' endonuclease subunit Ccr4
MASLHSKRIFQYIIVLGFASIGSALVKLATWNLLAPQYAGTGKYPWCEPDYLDWQYRESLIIPQLLQLDADVICLQEVQVDVWPGLMSKLEYVYDGVLQNMTNDHRIANAILIRKEFPFQIERVESRSRILLVVLRKESSFPKHMYVASVHLEAGVTSDNDMQRYHQIKSIFKRLSHHCQLDGISLQDAPIVLAGDFNMLRSNMIYQCLSDGQLIHPDNVKNKPPIPTTKLRDVFLMDTRPSVQMTYAKGYVLDYIWASNCIGVGKPLELSPSATQAIPQTWPSQDHPSDHLPIGMELII